METSIQQQQNLNFRAVTITDLNAIISLYQQQNTSLIIEKFPLTNHFGLPLYVAECEDKIVGYSYATVTKSDEYYLNTTIDTSFSNNLMNENLIRESELFFKNEWQNGTNRNLTAAIIQLINWLNNSNS